VPHKPQVPQDPLDPAVRERRARRLYRFNAAEQLPQEPLDLAAGERYARLLFRFSQRSPTETLQMCRVKCDPVFKYGCKPDVDKVVDMYTAAGNYLLRVSQYEQNRVWRHCSIFFP
jgi:hypothetical protein